MEKREKPKNYGFDYLFIFSLFSIVLSVLRITASDYLFIFSLFSIVLSVLRIAGNEKP
jgi:hypothetical protein